MEAHDGVSACVSCRRKPISLRRMHRVTSILAGGPGPGDLLQLLLKLGWVISTELRRIGQKLAQDRWACPQHERTSLTHSCPLQHSEYAVSRVNPSQEMSQALLPGLGMGGHSELGVSFKRVGLNWRV